MVVLTLAKSVIVVALGVTIVATVHLVNSSPATIAPLLKNAVTIPHVLSEAQTTLVAAQSDLAISGRLAPVRPVCVLPTLVILGERHARPRMGIPQHVTPRHALLAWTNSVTISPTPQSLTVTGRLEGTTIQTITHVLL